MPLDTCAPCLARRRHGTLGGCSIRSYSACRGSAGAGSRGRWRSSPWLAARQIRIDPSIARTPVTTAETARAERARADAPRAEGRTPAGRPVVERETAAPVTPEPARAERVHRAADARLPTADSMRPHRCRTRARPPAELEMRAHRWC